MDKVWKRPEDGLAALRLIVDPPRDVLKATLEEARSELEARRES